MRVYAHQNDTVDAICWRYFGVTAGVVEQVLQLNPGLTDTGVILPHGTLVVLPDALPPQTARKMVKLWD